MSVLVPEKIMSTKNRARSSELNRYVDGKGRELEVVSIGSVEN